MSRSRFTALLGAAAVAVAVGAFLVGLAVFDDGDADDPPAVNGSDQAADPNATDEGVDETTTTAPPAGDVRTDALPSPSWIVVVTSERDEADATRVATEVAAAGHPAGVLRSDDYPSLNPGFWVSYSGPFADSAAAADAAATLTGEGREGVYVRCAGARPDCNPGPPDDGDDDDGRGEDGDGED